MKNGKQSVVSSPTEDPAHKKRADIDKIVNKLRWLALGEYWLYPLGEGKCYDLDGDLNTLERSVIETALQHCHGNESATAKLLGISRDKLRYRLEKARSKAASTPK